MRLNLSYYNTASNTKVAVVYSRSGFVSDSTDISGGIGPDGLPLISTGNGTFLTPAIVPQENTTTNSNFRFALNGSSGIVLQAGQSLTLRTYHSCGSSSSGRYAKMKDLYLVGESKNTTGVKDLPAALFSFSPNPAHDVLTLDHPSVKGGAVFSIYDLAGKKLLSQKASPTQTRLDIGSLSNGLYVIECLESNGSKSALKFVKQ